MSSALEKCVQALTMFYLLSAVLLKEIDSKADLLQEESITIPAEHRAFPALLDHDLVADLSSSSLSSGVAARQPNLATSIKSYEPNAIDSWQQGRAETSQIKTINVKCEKNSMKVNVEFDRPFHGLIFSKGHYSDPKCVHLPAGTGQLQANFEIFLGSCGMSSSEHASSSASSLGLFIENTIIVQYDPQVQEIWDQARRLRCTWYDFYEKAVSFRPFNVDMLDAVTANFLGDNIQCWMQIQVGKGPWASEVAGIVKIGQTMTMVLAIKDDENKFDMLVRNCIAHDGKHAPIQLVDEYGCIVRSKIMSKFQKVKNFGPSASVVSYAYFQAFKFPDSMNVHFQCVIQVCRFECPQPTCESEAHDFGNDPREIDNDKKFINRMGDLGSANTTRSIPVAMHYTSTTTTANNQSDHQQQQQQAHASHHRDTTSGMPRMLKLRKREIVKKDVNTEKVIQVVAPGDVAFNLPLTSSSETGGPTRTMYDDKTATICMSTIGFTSGLVMLILLLVITCIVTVFLAIRLQNMSIASKNVEAVDGRRCSRHLNTVCTCDMSLVPSAPYFMRFPGVGFANIS